MRIERRRAARSGRSRIDHDCWRCAGVASREQRGGEARGEGTWSLGMVGIVQCAGPGWRKHALLTREAGAVARRVPKGTLTMRGYLAVTLAAALVAGLRAGRHHHRRGAGAADPGPDRRGRGNGKEVTMASSKTSPASTPAAKVQPMLAESWTVSPDGLTYSQAPPGGEIPRRHPGRQHRQILLRARHRAGQHQQRENAGADRQDRVPRSRNRGDHPEASHRRLPVRNRARRRLDGRAELRRRQQDQSGRCWCIRVQALGQGRPRRNGTQSRQPGSGELASVTIHFIADPSAATAR